MNSKFIIYTGDPSDPQSHVAYLVEVETEDDAWARIPGIIYVQRFDPIGPEWRRTGDPDWDSLRGGLRVM
jgi:hypothetical protein